MVWHYRVCYSSAYVCLYYLEEPEMSAQELRSMLAEHLPYYMIPSRFMKLDSIPDTKIVSLIDSIK